jgi:hypothetical protein
MAENDGCSKMSDGLQRAMGDYIRVKIDTTLFVHDEIAHNIRFLCSFCTCVYLGQNIGRKF